MRKNVARNFFTAAEPRHPDSLRIDKPPPGELLDRGFDRSGWRSPVHELLLEMSRADVPDHANVEAKHGESAGRVHLDWVLIAGSSAKKIVAASIRRNNHWVAPARLVTQRLHQIPVPTLAVFVNAFDPFGRTPLECLELRVQI